MRGTRKICKAGRQREGSVLQTEAEVPGETAVYGEIQSEAVQALVALGYGSTEALKAVRKVEIQESTEVEDVLKLALKYMAL